MSDIVGSMTERLLVDAGIGAGMRVLDAGCGQGDVLLLVARLRPLVAGKVAMRALLVFGAVVAFSSIGICFSDEGAGIDLRFDWPDVIPLTRLKTPLNEP